MTILEQKAYSHVDRIFGEIIDKYKTAPWNEFREALAQIYLAGITEALAGQWRSVEDELPEDEEYVLIDGPNGIEAAVWNEHYQVWDDSDGDDFMYKKDAVKMWMSIPQPPVYARTPKDESE